LEFCEGRYFETYIGKFTYSSKASATNAAMLLENDQFIGG
jgi:hypothetical protein